MTQVAGCFLIHLCSQQINYKMDTSNIVTNFIQEIWNNRNFSSLDKFLHPEFKDHSLPPALPTGKTGLIQWITQTGLSFEHQTHIEDLVSQGDNTIIKIKMMLTHTGEWRNIQPTGISLQTPGFRHFKLKDGKIIEHWALIDGQTIENILTEASHGCQIKQP